MTNDNHPILVFGATGRQGGSVAKALLKAKWPVRALVRDQSAPTAVALQEAGAEVIHGSFEDRQAVQTAMKGVYGVFSVLPATLTAEEEVRCGTSIADLAVESGVRHLVHSSGASVGDKLTGVARFDAKPRIEAHIRNLPVIATIVRPMIFMEMLVRPGFGLNEGRLLSLIRRDHAIQLTAVEDIGKFVSAIFADQERFGGLTLKIASDRVTGAELEAALTEVAGRPITYARLPEEILTANPDLAHMARSLEDGPLADDVDLDAMRAINPDLLSFRTWLAEIGRRSLLESLLWLPPGRQEVPEPVSR